MFDRTYIRGWIGIFWFIAFVGLWVMLQYILLDSEKLISDLNLMEAAVIQEDWTEASRAMADFEKDWKDQRLYAQIANGEATVSTFTEKLSQAKTLVMHEEDDVLSTIGELKDLARSVAVVFPGP